MIRVIRRTKQVADDIIEIYGYLAVRSPKAAERVLTAIEQSVNSLLETPGVGRLWNSTRPELNGMRVTTVTPFRNYLIFFRAADRGVDVVRIVHGARELPRIVDQIELDFD